MENVEVENERTIDWECSEEKDSWRNEDDRGSVEDSIGPEIREIQT